MSNKDLLKQAIAEAKTIREAAIANAKEALEETLTPHLKEMLAQKLQEMEDADDMEETVNGAEAKTYAEDPRAHGNLELNEEEEEEAPEEEGEEEGEEEEELSVEDMSVEDLKDLIRDIVAQETGNDEEAEMETGEEAPEGDDMTSMDGDSEEIDINELLAELEGMEEGYTQGTGETPGKPTHSYSQKPGAESGDRKGPNDGYVKEDVLDESLMGSVVDMLGVSNDTAQMLIAAVGGLGVVGASAITSKLHDMALKGTFGAKAQASAKAASQLGAAAGAATQQRSVKPVESGDEMEEGLGDAIKGAAQKIGGAVKKGNEKFDTWIDKTGGKLDKANLRSPYGGQKAFQESAELNEALKAVKILRNQLQEVNLLNAKLLYVNKVFKSNNLSEGQKVNVIAAFDKAETVKEVKLVFETVSKNVVAKPAALKEHRSFASKATGNAQTTAPKEILSEVSEQVARWQKLAGIIKS